MLRKILFVGIATMVLVGGFSPVQGSPKYCCEKGDEFFWLENGQYCLQQSAQSVDNSYCAGAA